jgi:parvulin-like peptidyl-prolyl isomerase
VAAVLLGAALLAPACRREPAALAEVAGREVTIADLDAVVLAETGKPPEDVAPDLVAALFEAYLEEEVILAASPVPADRLVPLATRGMRVRELLSELCPAPSEPSDAEIAARLAQQPPGSERVLLRQLILPDLAAARAARQRLQEGEDFASLSKELSRAANAAQGGAIGWVERGQLVPEFEAVIFGLADGGVSQPVTSNAGWHVFQVVARRAPGTVADPTVRARVRDELVAIAAGRIRHDCVRELARKVGVKVECAGATFPCRNPFEEQP